MDFHKRPKILIRKVYYQNFHQPNRLNSTLPTRIAVIRKINRLKQEIIQSRKNYNKFERFNLDLLYFKKAVIKLQTYLDLLSYC